MTMLDGQRIVITGAAGYLGSTLAARLGGAEPGDVTDPAFWERVLPGAEVVFHLAAHEHRHGAETSAMDDLAVNAGSTLRMLETCRIHGYRPRIVFASTSNIAGRPAVQPVDESAPDDPRTLFAIHKLTAEHMLRHYGRTHGIESAICRFVNVYGAGASRELALRSALNRMIDGALRSGTLRLFANRGCRRDYLHLDDAIDALVAAAGAASREPLSYLVGSGEATTFAEAAALIADAVESCGRPRPAVTLDEQTALEDVAWRELVADSSAFRAATGWRAAVALRDGIRRTASELLSFDP